MLLALWPLFISTTPPAPPQDISGLITQYAEQKYEKHVAKHVKLHVNTQQKQEVTGSISTQSLVTKQTSLPDTFVSTHYHLNIATAHSQSIVGTISATPSDKSIQIAYKHIGLYASSVQNQHIVGKITLSSAIPISDVGVSTYSLANVSTAQIQEVSGKISTHHFVDANNTLSVKASTYQRQAISGRIITNDDEEMLMVLMALLELDDEIA